MPRRQVPSSKTAITTHSDQTSGKMLRRTEAARMLGVSVSTLRRREGELISPVVGPGGVHLFDESEVRSTMVTIHRRQSIASVGIEIGEVAAAVFELLDEKVNQVEIVKRLKLSPDVVISLSEQWAHMRGGFVIYQEDLGKIAMHLRSRNARSGGEMLAHVKTRIGTLLRLGGVAQCRVCGENSACICESCVVLSRGPIMGVGCRLERRTKDDGSEEIQVVVNASWSEAIDAGNTAAILRSDWYPSDNVERSDIADFFEALGAVKGRNASQSKVDSNKTIDVATEDIKQSPK